MSFGCLNAIPQPLLCLSEHLQGFLPGAALRELCLCAEGLAAGRAGRWPQPLELKYPLGIKHGIEHPKKKQTWRSIAGKINNQHQSTMDVSIATRGFLEGSGQAKNRQKLIKAAGFAPPRIVSNSSSAMWGVLEASQMASPIKEMFSATCSQPKLRAWDQVLKW